MGNDNRQSVTILSTIRADGKSLPPFLIAKGQETTKDKPRFPKWWSRLSELVAGTSWEDATCVQAPNAYITEGLFLLYIKEVFLPATAHQRREGQPVVLLYDNCKPHISLAVLDLLAEQHVIVVGLPPHSSHATQPLDVACMQPLKHHFKDAEQRWRMKGSNRMKVASPEV